MRDKLIELIQESDCVETWDYYTDDLIEPYPIDALADYLIANGVTVNEWRPASEPPKEEGRYLCVTEDYYTKPTVYIYNFANDLSKRCWSIYEKISGWYECDSEFGNVLVDDVTHWMPLPQAPKGEK